MAPLKAVRDSKHIEKQWESSERWSGIRRDYSAEDVLRLRGSIEIKYTLAEMGAERLFQLLHSEPYVSALGALTGNQAVQQVRAGLKAIYLSGWQVAADANLAGHMYPDQSLYPSNSVPQVVKRINQALQRADYSLPLVGFGQGYQSMTPAIEAFEELALEGRLRHGGHPVLRWCISNTAIERDAAGNRKPTKAKSYGRIDAAVAALMAVGAAKASGETTVDVGLMIA